MLNKELSHFAESKNANQISEFITSTFMGIKGLRLHFLVVVGLTQVQV